MNTRRYIKKFGTVVVLMSALTLAVSCSEDGNVETINIEPKGIIGGYSAPSSFLNHTGALLIDDCYTLEPFCSATLIAPEVIVTAKHCAEIALGWDYQVYWGVGPDAYNPVEVIAVAGGDLAPLDEGGFVGMGKDVGVLYLDHPPASPVTPVTPRPSSEIAVGDRMVNVGFGAFSTTYAFDGQRRIGRETVAATAGLTFEAIFGDFESFVEWLYTGQVTDEDYLEILPEDVLEWLMEMYEEEVLLEGSEAVTGLADNDTQSCYGDSGGPLMKYVAGSGWQTYGVVSGGLDSWRSVCDFGTVFATFDAEVMAFLESANDWVDPCGDVTMEGMCQNNTVTKCISDVTEGIREVQVQDCTDTGQLCVLVDGEAVCGTPQPYAANSPYEASDSCGCIGDAAREAVSEVYSSKTTNLARFR